MERKRRKPIVGTYIGTPHHRCSYLKAMTQTAQNTNTDMNYGLVLQQVNHLVRFLICASFYNRPAVEGEDGSNTLLQFCITHEKTVEQSYQQILLWLICCSRTMNIFLFSLVLAQLQHTWSGTMSTRSDQVSAGEVHSYWMKILEHLMDTILKTYRHIRNAQYWKEVSKF